MDPDTPEATARLARSWGRPVTDDEADAVLAELDAARARIDELEAEPDLAAAEQIADRALRFNAEYPEDRAVVVVAALARAGMLRRALDVVTAPATTTGEAQ